MKVMKVNHAGWVELEDEHILVDARTIDTVYSSIPFKIESNGRQLTDEVSAHRTHVARHLREGKLNFYNRNGKSWSGFTTLKQYQKIDRLS